MIQIMVQMMGGGGGKNVWKSLRLLQFFSGKLTNRPSALSEDMREHVGDSKGEEKV